MCNCDSGRDGIDEGYNTHAQLLPVMQLYVGGTNEYSSTNITIGPLKCARRRKSFWFQKFIFKKTRTEYSIHFFQKSMKLSHLSTETKIWSVRKHLVLPLFSISICKCASHIHKWPYLRGSRLTESGGINCLLEVCSISGNKGWFPTFLEGRLVAQIVNAGRTHEIVSDFAINDNNWHSIYWEADSQGNCKLSVDNREKIVSAFHVLPDTFTYFFGKYFWNILMQHD